MLHTPLLAEFAVHTPPNVPAHFILAVARLAQAVQLVVQERPGVPATVVLAVRGEPSPAVALAVVDLALRTVAVAIDMLACEPLGLTWPR